MAICGGGSDASKDIRQLEAERQIRINEGTGALNQAFSGFDEPFYRRRREAFLAHAMPQFGDQFRQTQNQLLYNLAGRGLDRSGAASFQQGELNKEGARQQGGLVDASFGMSNDLRRQIEGQRSSLLAQLQASADPSSTAQQAISSASQFSAPSVLQPLGNLFQNFANLYLANQFANATQQQQSPAIPGYGYSVGNSQQIRRF